MSEAPRSQGAEDRAAYRRAGPGMYGIVIVIDINSVYNILLMVLSFCTVHTASFSVSAETLG